MWTTMEGMTEKANNDFSLLVWSQETEYQNLRFPVDLSNPFAVATVLNQEPGKLKIKELREGKRLVLRKPAPGRLWSSSKTQLDRCFVLPLEMCFSLSQWFWFDCWYNRVCSLPQFWTKALRFQKQDRWRKHSSNRKSDRTLTKSSEITLSGKYRTIICIKWRWFW